MDSATWRRCIVSRLSCQTIGGGGLLPPTDPVKLEKCSLNQRITAKRFIAKSFIATEESHSFPAEHSRSVCVYRDHASTRYARSRAYLSPKLGHALRNRPS